MTKSQSVFTENEGKITNPCKQKQDKQVIENENVITKRKLSTEWLEDKLKKITPKTETKQKY